MNQDIINKTLAMNLFEESKKSSNWFVAVGNNIRMNDCYFTYNIPFHYFQYVCLGLSYSEYWSEFLEYKDYVPSYDSLIDSYNREQKLDSVAILNCRENTTVGAFSRFWLKTKVGKNLNVCFGYNRYNVANKFPDNINQAFSFNYVIFNKKFNRFGDTKSKYIVIPVLSKYEKDLLVEFSKLWLVKK